MRRRCAGERLESKVAAVRAVRRSLGPAVVVFGLLLSGSSAEAANARIVSAWNGKEIGAFYVSKPHKLGLVMKGTGGYWLIRDAKWKHWGSGTTVAKGKLASAALDGTPVKVKAKKRTYHSCLKQGDAVDIYSRAKIQIGEGGWESIPRGTLTPQCNNLRPGNPVGSSLARDFQQCGDFPSDFTYGLRVDGVSCSRGKKVSERYYRTTVKEHDDDVSFGSWRCTSKSYGDGGNVKCKQGSDQVRFALGG